MESNLLKLLRGRRSIRQFTGQPIEQEKIEALVESALRAPSSRGRNPWEIILVTAPHTLQRLAAAKQHGSAFLAGAAMAIVFAAETTKSDVWTEDCSIAAIIVQLMAEELGLGSCWVQIRLRSHSTEQSSEAYLKSLLGLPESHSVECIIAIGYPAEEKVGHLADELLFSQVHREQFNRS